MNGAKLIPDTLSQAIFDFFSQGSPSAVRGSQEAEKKRAQMLFRLMLLRNWLEMFESDLLEMPPRIDMEKPMPPTLRKEWMALVDGIGPTFATVEGWHIN